MPGAQQIVPIGFAVAGALFLFAGLKPALQGQALNVALFAVGVLFLVLGLAIWRHAGRGAGPPI